MQCVNGHELPPGEERECPSCGQPARSLVSAARRSGARGLVIGLAVFLGIGGAALLIGAVAPLEPPGSGILALFLVLPFVGGLFYALGSTYSLVRAPAVVRKRIKESKEPVTLASFVCPKCKTQNQGPFQKTAPECQSCRTRVLGVRCWRCGTMQPQEAFDGEEPRTEFTCTSCGQAQEMPLAKTTAWWR
jgi:hypothetical protein